MKNIKQQQKLGSQLQSDCFVQFLQKPAGALSATDKQQNETNEAHVQAIHNFIK